MVISALQGKVAGLHINNSSTGLGGSSKITIRGNSSLTDNNQPLWIVDGVPFSENSSSSTSAYGGIDRGSTALDINPDDIESISVLKGPNAAALYGSRAGNGMILVTTKKGSQQSGLGMQMRLLQQLESSVSSVVLLKGMMMTNWMSIRSACLNIRS